MVKRVVGTCTFIEEPFTIEEMEWMDKDDDNACGGFARPPSGWKPPTPLPELPPESPGADDEQE
jgi:hypothetical protein